MVTAITRQPSILKVVVNNNKPARHPLVRHMPYGLQSGPVNLKPGELIAATVFNMLGVDEDLPNSDEKRIFWKKCRRQKLRVHAMETTAQSPARPVIDRLRQIFSRHPEIKAGRTVWNNTAEHPFELVFNNKSQVIALSKLYQNKEFLIVYNASLNEPAEAFVRLNRQDAALKHLQVVYGYETCGNIHIYNTIQQGEKISYIKLYLKPMHLVILKNF